MSWRGGDTRHLCLAPKISSLLNSAAHHRDAHALIKVPTPSSRRHCIDLSHRIKFFLSFYHFRTDSAKKRSAMTCVT